MKYKAYKIVIILLVFLYNSSVFSQEIDSIYTRQYQLREVFWNQFLKNPSVHQKLPLSDFTETSIYGEIKSQRLSKKQNPNKISYYGFKSKGVLTLKNKIKLFGNLDFSRSYTEEFSYQLFNNNSEEFSSQLLASPNYPLAIRSGNGENLHYNLTGGIAGSLTKRFPFSVKINYNLDKYFGLTIPKTEQEVINYSGEFEFGYAIQNHQFFGIFALEKEQNNFTFNSQGINTIPINSLAFPEYYAGFSVGYGDVYGFDNSLLAGITDTESKTYGLGYNLSKINYAFTARYSYTDSTERYYSTDFIDSNNLAALFKRKIQTITASYITQFGNQKLIIDAEFLSGKGINTHAFDNFSENSNSRTINKNYQQIIDQITINAYLEKRKDDVTQLGVNLTTKIKDDSVKDLNTTIQDIMSVATQLSVNKDMKLGENTLINVEGGIHFYQPLSNSISYTRSNSSTSAGSVIPPRNTFTEDVIQHDYELHILKKFGSSIGLRYQTRIKKRTTATILFAYKTLTGLKSNIVSNASNSSFNVSLNLKY